MATRPQAHAAIHRVAASQPPFSAPAGWTIGSHTSGWERLADRLATLHATTPPPPLATFTSRLSAYLTSPQLRTSTPPTAPPTALLGHTQLPTPSCSSPHSHGQHTGCVQRRRGGRPPDAPSPWWLSGRFGAGAGAVAEKALLFGPRWRHPRHRQLQPPLPRCCLELCNAAGLGHVGGLSHGVGGFCPASESVLGARLALRLHSGHSASLEVGICHTPLTLTVAAADLAPDSIGALVVVPSGSPCRREQSLAPRLPG